MKSDPRIAILIPCLDEAPTIEKVITAFRAYLPQAEIVVGDNNSSDETASIAQRAGAHVVRERHPGKGNIMRRLFADIDADFYIMVDGDATYDPSVAPLLIRILAEDRCDLVNVARKPVDSASFRTGHRFGNRLLTSAVQIMFGTSTTDVLSGYKAFSRRFVKTFPALSSGFEIDTEIMIHASELRLAVHEIEAIYGKRPDESVSKLRTFRDGLRILHLIDHLVRQEHPFGFFGTLSALLIVASLFFGLPVVIQFFKTGLVPRLPTALLATGLTLCAVGAFFTGIILDAVSQTRREVKRLSYLSFPSKPDSGAAPLGGGQRH
jgi:glycosyltransferase involved in cell wall biosynthesis